MNKPTPLRRPNGRFNGSIATAGPQLTQQLAAIIHQTNTENIALDELIAAAHQHLNQETDITTRQAAFNKNSDLRGADLSGLNLTAVDLRGKDLTGANLENAVRLAAVVALETIALIRDMAMAGRAEAAIETLESGKCFWWRGNALYKTWEPGAVHNFYLADRFEIKVDDYLRCGAKG